MDQRGNLLHAGITLLGVAIVWFFIYSLLSGPLRTIWGATEDASTNPNTPDVWTQLNAAWMIIGIVVVILISLWFFAKIHSREVETQVYMR